MRHVRLDGSVADPHHFDPDPDPTVHSNTDPDPNFQFALDPDAVLITHFFPDLDPPRLQNDPQRLPPFHFESGSGSCFTL